MFNKLKFFKKTDEFPKEICPKCGGTLIVRNGKYGEFLGCNNFPKCKFSKDIQNELPMEKLSVSISKHVSIISGEQFCFRCRKKTRVSGLGLLNDDTKFLTKLNLKILDYGFDIYILPWSEIIDQFDDTFKIYLRDNYGIERKFSRTIGESYYANTCKHCKVIQGDNFVYTDTGHGSPFDYYSKESLVIEQIKILSTEKIISCFFNKIGSPTLYYLPRSEIKKSKYFIK
ncbi:MULTISPECIES: topoisomerase DNA-binding C4 zinc finger domain-containing protein [Enterococcus]|nr:topoisomerase DNA-binding C4 zinc finger domain-containing protein [Enterococcus faecalis]EHK9432469.1 topoisomerase DNA-binding C4 zinc finger domain-containing protein [Enterococcus faecalis]EHM3209165.1 topoisomerase DNA-binding C4 zinc finger domain-containing protein [Enterococcus faecalis]EHS2074184.1 topoisomerase DNA-binding C4 zinc finger domain-containing protein [Enterococcus faecalis]EHS7996159.1 topoisomerase DNA-binding C4 zinc finger domain-containing protein [Enterococcus fae